ncbi:SDR family oxidoreductase [Demequina sp.]|uniref:SDR family NAD(P)-dependent oxidoreductase n=1 Tax=Demequina sp. TaxID=2050685 RepID=UPI0025BCF80F|nr:SDR family oxidoreductase [Demequina sp.]
MATALITGASSGLGEEFAWNLAAAGRDVVLVARSRDRLSETAEMLAGATGVNVEILAADLSTPEGTQAVATRLADSVHPIDLLVNNAGLGLKRPFLESTVDEEVGALDVMVRAVLILSHAAAGAMVARGHGAILNVSSVATWLGNGTYAAHKAWVTSFTEGLATQLKGTGVSATAVLPGLTHTEFHERAELDAYDEIPEIAWLEPEYVVAAALAGVRRKQVLVTPSVRYGTMTGVIRVLPRTWVRALARKSRN